MGHGKIVDLNPVRRPLTDFGTFRRARSLQAVEPRAHKVFEMALLAPKRENLRKLEPIGRRSRLGVPEIELGRLPIAVINRVASAQLLVRVAQQQLAEGKRPIYVTSANGEVVSRAADPATRSLFLAADLIHADGQFLVLASRLLGHRALPERVATTDLIHDTARLAQERGVSFYLLGASRQVNAAAVARLRQLYPRLTIAGARDGYFGASEEAGVVEAINRARPGILWVGMGVPREQAFVVRNRDQLNRVGVIKTSGGLFDFLAGTRSRAPLWMQAAGLEWSYRLILEPRRLFFRYLKTSPHAILILLSGLRS